MRSLGEMPNAAEAAPATEEEEEEEGERRGRPVHSRSRPMRGRGSIGGGKYTTVWRCSARVSDHYDGAGEAR